MLTRLLTATVASTLLPLLAQAAEVHIDVVNNAPQIRVTPETNEGVAIFQRFDDVWVLADKNTKLVLRNRPQGYGGAETLQVNGGSGLRLRFTQLPPLGVEKQEKAFVIGADKPAPLGKLQSQQTKDGVRIAKNGLSKIMRATSIDTRESYVAISRTDEGGENQPRVVNDVRLLGSLIGVAAVAETGVPLSYQTQPQGYELKPMRTPLTTAVAKGAQTVAPAFLDNLFERLATTEKVAAKPAEKVQISQPLSRDPRDYSINVSDILNRYGRSTPRDAVSRMEAALAAVNGLSIRPTLSAETLNAVDDMVARVVVPKALPEHTVLIDYGDRGATELARIERRYLERMLQAKTPEERDAATFEMARIQFFLGRFPEVIGLTGTMQRDGQNPWPQNDAARLLLAAAQMHVNRLDEAAKVLASLDMPSMERGVWEAALASLEHKPEQAVEKFAKTLEVTQFYPRQTQQWLRYQYAHSLFELNKLEEALAEVDKLSVIDSRGYVLPMAQLLLGRIYEAMDEPGVAEQIYVNLSSHPNQVVANRALYHFLRLLHTRGELLGDEAIMRFENLRYMWRGDDVERDTLFLLGKMYLEENRLREALVRLRYLNENFPDAPQIDEATKMMTRTFADIFIRGVQDESLDGLGMLALYYEFRELTPPGRDGDKLINEIVRRLTDIGLYDRAIKMLEEQLAFRIKDPDVRAEAGWHLAQLYWLNTQPEKGLEALRKTISNKAIPAETTQKRQVMMARLYLQQRAYDEAIKAVSGVDTPEAIQLRGEAYLELGQAADVVQTLAPLYSTEGGTEWQPEDVAGFTRYAMALAQLREAAKLADLNQRYQNGIIQHDMRPQMAFLLELADSPQDVGQEQSVNPWYRSYDAMKKYNALEERYNELQKNWDRIKRVDLDRLKLRRR